MHARVGGGNNVVVPKDLKLITENNRNEINKTVNTHTHIERQMLNAFVVDLWVTGPIPNDRSHYMEKKYIQQDNKKVLIEKDC